jgi:hypothetical protein
MLGVKGHVDSSVPSALRLLVCTTDRRDPREAACPLPAPGGGFTARTPGASRPACGHGVVHSAFDPK